MNGEDCLRMDGDGEGVLGMDGEDYLGMDGEDCLRINGEDCLRMDGDWGGHSWYGWGGRSSAGTLPPRRNAGPKIESSFSHNLVTTNQVL